MKDTIQIKTSLSEFEGRKYLNTEIYLNNEKVNWNSVEVFEFFRDIKQKGINSKCWEEAKRQTRSFYYADRDKYSSFTPFSCSCGNAGCAGIWNGIQTKHKKHTVEWRTRKEDGYYFLKRFYSFDKEQYYTAVVEAWQVIGNLLNVGAGIQDNAFGEEVLLKEQYEDVEETMKTLSKQYK